MSRDYPASQGGAAIGARLRRLSDRVDREADKLYAAFDVEFEQRWFGVVNQLAATKEMSVGELSAALGISHAAVSQTRTALLERGLIVAEDHPSDARRRVLALSAKGRKLVERLMPLWQALNSAAGELDREAGRPVEALARLEAALDKQSLAERVRAKLQK
jgi:DNA-binding MarR family transcriptional regulator